MLGGWLEVQLGPGVEIVYATNGEEALAQLSQARRGRNGENGGRVVAN